MPIRPYRRGPRRIRRPSQRNPKGRALFGSGFVDVLDRGSATPFARLLQIDLAAFCQRCHILHDKTVHLRRRRLTYFARRALGDLFTGPYPT